MKERQRPSERETERHRKRQTEWERSDRYIETKIVMERVKDREIDGVERREKDRHKQSEREREREKGKE